MADSLAVNPRAPVLEGGPQLIVSSNSGYIRLHRKMLDNPIWTQLVPAVAKVAIYFLLRAGYRTKPWYNGSETIELPAGSFVTSLTTTAKACRISVQQTRDAFTHLKRTRFATYQGTHRYTVVTVVNWASYQASGEEGNTVENTLENSKRTLNKKLRSKKHTPLPPKGAEDGFPDGLDNLPFGTPLDPQPEMVNGNNHSAAHTGNGRASAIAEVIQATAARIYGRHPEVRRDIGIEAVGKKLAAILKHRRVPAQEQADFLQQIDRNHAALCASEQWSKEEGQFAKGLEGWLSPSKERYLVEPPTPAAEQAEAPRIIL